MALIVAISPKGKNGPPPPPAKKKSATTAPPPPPGSQATPDPDAGSNDTEPDADDKQITPQEVGYGENDLCQDCQNMGDDGNCMKYGFPVTETGHCLAGYEPKNQGDQEPTQQAA